MAATFQEIEDAITHENFSHARQGDGCWRDLVWIYHRAPESPSGYILAVGAPASIADPIIRAKRQTSALSPTER